MSGQKSSKSDPSDPSRSYAIGRRLEARTADAALAEMGLTPEQAEAEGWYLLDLDAPEAEPSAVDSFALLDERIRRIALVPLG